MVWDGTQGRIQKGRRGKGGREIALRKYLLYVGGITTPPIAPLSPKLKFKCVLNIVG